MSSHVISCALCLQDTGLTCNLRGQLPAISEDMCKFKAMVWLERFLVTTRTLENPDLDHERQPGCHPFSPLLLQPPILPNSLLLLKQNFRGLRIAQLPEGGRGLWISPGNAQGTKGRFSHYRATVTLSHISYQRVRLLEGEAQGT